MNEPMKSEFLQPGRSPAEIGAGGAEDGSRNYDMIKS